MTAFENNAERVECFSCKGSGRLLEDSWEACCSGTPADETLSCPRCDGEGTVLVDKPCVKCDGVGANQTMHYGEPTQMCKCSQCWGTGVEPRDKRMERLMREAEHHYRLLGENWVADYSAGCALRRSTTSTLSDLVGAIKETSTPHPVAAFTGWSHQDWLMRKDGQG